jgi:hypothetical protein
LTIKYKQSGSLNSVAEDLFVELFCDTFGPDKSQYLFIQYPFTDIYGNRRLIDFALESEELRIAIEIDGETYHNPYKVSYNKYYDDLTKQNSLIYQNWKVYRWVYQQLKNQPEKVKDELRTFVGEIPIFKMLDEDIRWVRVEEFGRYEFCPADVEVAEMLRKVSNDDA